MTQGTKFQDFIFALSALDMNEFFSGWPEDIVLVVWRQEAEDNYYIVPEDDLSRDLLKITKGRLVPVFPGVEGFPTAKISYADENDLVNRISRRPDLLESAQSLHTRVSQEAENLSAWDDIEEEEPAPDEGASGVAGVTPERRTASSGQERQLQTRVDEPATALVTKQVLASFSNSGRPRLVCTDGEWSLSVSESLIEEMKEDRLYLVLDPGKKRVAVLPEALVDEVDASAKWLLLPTVCANEAELTFSLDSGGDAASELFSTAEGERYLTLLPMPGDFLVFSLDDPPDRSSFFSKVEVRRYGLVAAVLLCMFGFFLVQLAPESTDAGSVQEEARPDFQSDSYMRSLIDRLFAE